MGVTINVIKNSLLRGLKQNCINITGINNCINIYVSEFKGKSEGFKGKSEGY